MESYFGTLYNLVGIKYGQHSTLEMIRCNDNH